MKELYLSLFENGWTMEDIDEMDIFWYLDVIAYKANKEEKQNKTTIDNTIL